MTSIKQKLDEITGANPAASWLDREFNGEMYVMPGTTLPAYRYTFCTFVDQRATKLIASTAEQKLREAGYPVRTQTHLTGGTRDFYWKVEVFIPRQMINTPVRRS